MRAARSYGSIGMTVLGRGGYGAVSGSCLQPPAVNLSGRSDWRMAPGRIPSAGDERETVPRRRGWIIASLLAVALLVSGTGAARATSPAGRWVASWAASPSDGSFPTDAALLPVPAAIYDQTARMVVTPHLGGSVLRVHLSNRFGSAPVTFGRVTVGTATADGVADLTGVTFASHETVTVPAGADVVSDAVRMPFAAFEPLAVSVYLPGQQGAPTKHWNANATSYYSPPGTGDLSTVATDTGFTTPTEAWFYLDGIDVEAAAPTRTIVAFGDSITDGFVASNPASIPVSLQVADKNGRYPDDLQRRIDAAGVPLSVVNAGVSDNKVLSDGGSQQPMAGPSALHRFGRDALDVPGVSGVLFMEGINDLGGPGSTVTASQLISGYEQIIAMAHTAGKKIWLGTIPPASNAVFDGTLLAPASEANREQVNAWIRSQHLADGVVDFDRALRDPANPTVMNPAYAGPDHLHPNLLGYEVMADTVPLSMLCS
ncbi:MAG TPA: GDSL-type esterase/lipase family protein [Acidimicrobiales bacterium]|nr:GDSL-type esterase/lipase family protein [Acidimicrobiales bacterium]